MAAGTDPTMDRGIAGASPEGFGFRTRSVHAGGRPDPATAPGSAHLPDDELRVRGHARRLDTVRAPEVRQHLQPDRQPDGGRVSKSAWPAWRAAWARWPRRAARRAELLVFVGWPAPASTSWGSSRLYGGTRTLLDVTLRRLGVDTAFVDRDEPDASGRGRARPRRPSHGGLGNPSGSRGRPGRPGRGRPRARHPPRGRRHAGHARPLPAHRARRRHRRPLRHQVPRRPRDVHRRRGRQVRPVRLGQREVSRS